MGFSEKLAGVKQTNWITEGFPDAEVKTIVELAKISARIERCRLDMGMTQQQFAEYMGVTQGMVSKWESREYNFTIRTLNEICRKINLELSVNLEQPCVKPEYPTVKWDSEKVENKVKQNGWITAYSGKEAIA